MSDKEAAFEKIKKLMSRFAEIEQEAKAECRSVRLQIGEIVSGLARSVETIAERAAVIRTLYWELRVSGDLLDQAFGAGNYRKVVGTYSSVYKCPNFSECNSVMLMTFKSRTDLSKFEFRLKKKKRLYPSDFCQTCIVNSNEQFREMRAEKEKRERQNNELLLAMRWPDFIRTERWEWLIHELGRYFSIRCVICKDTPAILSLCFEKTVTRYPLYSNELADWSILLCDSCLERSSDLLKLDWTLRYNSEYLWAAGEYNEKFDRY